MDRMTEMEVFVAIVDQGGFTGAANKLRMSKSAVSKHIAALEARLGVTLLNRTTRRVSLTDIGLSYYEKSLRALETVRDADLMVTSMQSAPQGTLRMSAASEFGSDQLVGALTPFLKQYPDVNIRMTLDNRIVDILAEDFDLAIRVGNLTDSSLKARKIATTQLAIVGSCEYFKTNGRPESIDDLAHHQLLHYSTDKTNNFWRVPAQSGEERQFRANSSLTVNDGRSLLTAAKAGLGLAYLPCFTYAQAVHEGRLQKVLTKLKMPILGVYVVYPPADYTQPKLRTFIDFMVDHFKGKGNEVW